MFGWELVVLKGKQLGRTTNNSQDVVPHSVNDGF